MTKAEKLQNEAKKYLEDQGFHMSFQSEGDISMHNPHIPSMTVHLGNDEKILFQLDWDIFRNHHVSYGEKLFSMDSYMSVPTRVKHVFNHAVIMLDLVAWSDVRADEWSCLRNERIGHISIEAFGPPLVREDEDLVLKFTLQNSDILGCPVMGFQYLFAPFGDMFFTQNLKPGQGVVFVSDIRRMQDEILHWCSLPDNPFRKLRSNCIFQFQE